MADTIFARILRGEIPVSFVHQDEICVAFPDNSPQAPVHILVIPRETFEDIIEADDQTIGHIMNVAAALGEKMCPGGFRLVTNTGSDAGQSVQHWHVHILGGRELTWPPG